MTKTALGAPTPTRFTVEPARAGGTISPLLFGHNLEHTRRAIWQGLSAQMLANRKFAGGSTTDMRASSAELGSIGRLITHGAPGPEGVAAHWYGLGSPWTNFYVDDEISYTGRTAQRLDVLEGHRWGGIGQAGLHVQAGTRYDLRVILRTHFAMQARLTIDDESKQQTVFEEAAHFAGNEWHVWTTSWVAQRSGRARLEVEFLGKGTAWIGAASMLAADNFRGLRTDVLAQLDEMSAPLLRWPGGNFTRNWKWKDGLLDVDRRPPVAAKCHETLPFTDNYDFGEIGIDDFIAVCALLKAEPSLVLNIADDLQNACDLLEYCNGSEESVWGKVRSERGQREPYGVKLWSIGNETFGPWMGPACFPAEEYGEQVRRFAQALRRIDPAIKIVACGAEGGYTREVAASAAPDIDLFSAHHYYFAPEASAALEIVDLDAGLNASSSLRRLLETFRSEIVEGVPEGNPQPPVSLDEWNVWHWWFSSPFEHQWRSGAREGLYAASALNLFAREGANLGLHSAAFFQPVNEGCIRVTPDSAELTAAGQVFRLFRAHHGNAPVAASAAISGGGEDIDVCVSRDLETGRLAATLVNRSSTQGHALQLDVLAFAPTGATARLLSGADLRDPHGTFDETALDVALEQGAVRVDLPPYSVALLQLVAD